MEMYIARDCNAIIGFGGGSSIDCAKALGVCIARPNSSLAKMKGILKVHKKLARLAAEIGIAGEDTPADKAALDFIEAIKKMKKQFQIGDTISGIQEEDIPKLSRYADKEANPLYPVPLLMDAKELEQFYYTLMEKSNTPRQSCPQE